jgi:hypothetical protein
MTLQDEIDERRQEIKTDFYSMSIGELASLYENGEIDIHPEFQRYFRWDNLQKTRFIESIFLGIPIPPIFVAQQSNGIWDVVDGLQRLSTLFQLLGILKGEDNSSIPSLVLEKTRYLPSLENKRWQTDGEELESDDNFLTSGQMLLIKRARLDISIIAYDSSPQTKFELFQRLNTGGSPLTEQEVRNSILVSVNRDFYQWLRRLSRYEPYQECTSLSERQLNEQYDIELVLRYIIFRSLGERYLTTTNIGDLGQFITEQMLKISEDQTFQYELEEAAFKKTFDILSSTTGANSFRKYDRKKNKFIGSFFITPYEVAAFGIGYNYKLWNKKNLNLIEPKIREIWSREDITSNSGTGVRANSRLPTIVKIGRELFIP